MEENTNNFEERKKVTEQLLKKTDNASEILQKNKKETEEFNEKINKIWVFYPKIISLCKFFSL